MRTSTDTFRKWVMILKALDNPKSMYQLAEETKIRYQTIMKYLDDLEDLGLIERELDSGPPPKYIIKRTKKGNCITKCF